MRERGDSLLKQTQKMCQVVLKHVLFMKAKRSTWRWNTSWKNGETRYWSWQFESWENHGDRGGHGLPNSRATTFCCEASAEYQRSRSDSENLRTTQIDTLFSKIHDKIMNTTHLIHNQKIDSGSGQHRIVWMVRDGSQNAVHSMPIFLELGHRPLHMWAFLAERNSGQPTIR